MDFSIATLKIAHFPLVVLRKLRDVGNLLVTKKKKPPFFHWCLGNILVIFLQSSISIKLTIFQAISVAIIGLIKRPHYSKTSLF